MERQINVNELKVPSSWAVSFSSSSAFSLLRFSTSLVRVLLDSSSCNKILITIYSYCHNYKRCTIWNVWIVIVKEGAFKVTLTRAIVVSFSTISCLCLAPAFLFSWLSSKYCSSWSARASCSDSAFVTVRSSWADSESLFRETHLRVNI